MFTTIWRGPLCVNEGVRWALVFTSKGQSDQPDTRPYLLSGRVAIDGGVAICTLEFDQLSQREWAEATWRSIQHPGDAHDDP